jgi:hypothetical protein
MEAHVQPDDPDHSETDRPNEGGPPHISTDDPEASVTHNVGGTYAEGEFSVAAQRSAYRTEQFEPGPSHLASRTEERRSGFEEADPYEPVGGQATGK